MSTAEGAQEDLQAQSEFSFACKEMVGNSKEKSLLSMMWKKKIELLQLMSLLNFDAIDGNPNAKAKT